MLKKIIGLGKFWWVGQSTSNKFLKFYRSLVGTHFNDFKESGDTAWELSLGVELFNVCQNVMEVGLKPRVIGWLSKCRILQRKYKIC